MELYHASKEIVQYPEIRKTKYTKDFSWGFYCTNNMNQAIRWANRGIGEPIINYYEYVPTENLKILRFPEISDEWLDFIAECRSGKTHTYDIVEGPMANDTVWNYVNDLSNYYSIIYFLIPIIIYFFGIIVSLLLNIITNPIMKTKSLHKLSDFIDSIYDEL